VFLPFPKLIKHLSLALSALLAAGCGQNSVKVYTIPKEAPPAVTEQQPAASPQVKWTTPDGWMEQPASEMRVASFKVAGPNRKQADVSVIPLAGMAGSDLNNVNRWRGQIGLPPASEDEIQKAATPVEVSGQPALLYDLAGESNSILAAIQRRGDTTWFFKMTGDNKLVAQQKPAFLAFLKSFQFSVGATAEPTSGSPQWTPPSDWTEAPAGQFLVAKFLVSDGKAAINISSSAGDGGGLSANVNRWRRQLGLEEANVEELAKLGEPLAIPDGHAVTVELAGKDAALVGVVVLRPGQAWFYKLMGDPAVVGAQKQAFLKFAQGVKY
jgi:hypothetical protein